MIQDLYREVGSVLTNMEVMKQVPCESEANACIAGRAEVKGRVRIQIKKGDIMGNVKMRFKLETIITCT